MLLGLPLVQFAAGQGEPLHGTSDYHLNVEMCRREREGGGDFLPTSNSGASSAMRMLLPACIEHVKKSVTRSGTILLGKSLI